MLLPLARRFRIVPVALITLLTACGDPPVAPTSDAPNRVSLNASQSGAIRDSGVDTYPYAWLAYVECARGGQGDLLQLSGEVVYRWHFVRTPGGNWTGGDIAVVHHGTAVSLTDGTVYRAPLTNHLTDNFVAGQSIGSNTMRYRFVGPGPGNNLVVESTSVWNFGPDGLHVWFSDYTVTCGTDGANVPGSNEGADPIHEWPSE
jgi:hypothetical protein